MPLEQKREDGRGDIEEGRVEREEGAREVEQLDDTRMGVSHADVGEFE